MSRIVAIGERERVQGFLFAGVTVAAAADPDAVRAAWRELPDDVGLVILTPTAFSALDVAEPGSETPLTVVMPG